MLAGVRESTPLNRFYYLEADTSGIQGAPDLTRWALWSRCGVQDGHNANCTDNTPGYPFRPAQNFGTTQGVPQGLLDHSQKYYYMSRFAYSFFFCSTIFSGLAVLFGWLGMCSNLFSGCNSILTFLGFLTSAIATTLATALYVKARNAFRNDGRSAHLGTKLFAFAWTSLLLLFLASLGYLLGCVLGRSKSRRSQFDGPVPLQDEKRSKGRFFQRRGRRDQYPDGESQTHVINGPQSDRVPTPDRSSFYREAPYRET
ncbi:SUR7/PalI family-domain-containing protein [Lipomyces arxii]|uniref:SUR7/PalI family-domain-containing protein n=1 Tax=Lipomyces arxii TaxID=56418 RepID=UPI0034D0064A